MRTNILFGGKAGSGPNILTHILAEALARQGYYTFYSRDYQSLIRGGHNFNVMTFAEEPVYSNDKEMDIIVAMDENTENLHKKDLKKNGVILKGQKENMYYAGRIFKLLCIDFKVLEEQLKLLGKRFDENLKFAKQGYEEETKKVCEVIPRKDKITLLNGSQGIAKGAIASGLDIYYAYPMTPATPILGEIAKDQIKDNLIVLELENEIAVVNAGIGSAITGAKVMVGTSGGGFDLMTEGLSLTGMTEAPLVFYLAQRAGPATGVATYNSQGDLNLARHAGHGEFPRVVLAPGDPKEAYELTTQAFYFSHKFGVPSIVVSDKHLGESAYTITEKPVITKSQKSTVFGRFNGYEKDKTGSATENPEIVTKNVLNRLEKKKKIEKESEKFSVYKTFGKQDSNNVIVSWGSPKGAILDSIKDLNCKFIQVLYMEPFPKKIMNELKNKNIILVENNSTGQLSELIAEKTGIFIEDKNKILRFDGRPFLRNELNGEIKKRLK